MQCFYVFIHGTLEGRVLPPSFDVSQPDGFYCHRHVLAADERRAIDVAFERVRSNLNKGSGWLSSSDARLTLTAEEVRAAPFYQLLKPENRSHTFYEEDGGG